MPTPKEQKEELNRYKGRAKAAKNSMKKTEARLEKQGEEIAESAHQLITEFVRPSPKLLDAYCKLLEAGSVLASTVADYMDDGITLVQSAAKFVKGTRDDRSFFTMGEFVSFLKEAGFGEEAKKKRNGRKGSTRSSSTNAN